MKFREAELVDQMAGVTATICNGAFREEGMGNWMKRQPHAPASRLPRGDKQGTGVHPAFRETTFTPPPRISGGGDGQLWASRRQAFSVAPAEEMAMCGSLASAPQSPTLFERALLRVISPGKQAFPADPPQGRRRRRRGKKYTPA